MSTHTHDSMIANILKDPWTYISSIGTAYFLSIETIMNSVTPVLAFLGALGGVVLFVLGLREKWKSSKIQDMTIEKLRREMNK